MGNIMSCFGRADGSEADATELGDLGTRGGDASVGLSARDDFERWNSQLDAAYKQEHPGTRPGGDHRLYRAAVEEPSDVFRPGGRLQPSAHGTEHHDDRTFSVLEHQNGAPSHFTSTTRDLSAAEQIGSDGALREWVYVMDPHPNGRDVNAVRAANGQASLKPNFLDEQEVSIPGPIHAEDIRGALPLRDGSVDYAGLVRNPVYRGSLATGETDR
ncbi:scabin-related ADP-ribosyltransferase [Rhizosaccharibacter radicis]|uniref:Enterotoxin A family protein n=1 Tax=Rhizosaccharibacter radicis TaxID=2782605 RepID=A0ABT1VTM3_9PROT|nr:enterotoxin A family protein [Acetobacteraceae bacterium KSS12]